MISTTQKLQIAYTVKNEFIAMNLGLGIYGDDIVSGDDALKNLNALPAEYRYINKSNANRFSQIIKERKKSAKTAMKYKRVPMGGRLILNSVDVIEKDITIDNSDILKKYVNFKLENGEYTYIKMAMIDSKLEEEWDSKFGDRTVFSEKDLLDIEKYQDESIDTGNICITHISKNSYNYNIVKYAFAAGFNENGSIELFINKERCAKGLGDNIVRLLKVGRLACVRLLNYPLNMRGCILYNTDSSFKIKN